MSWLARSSTNDYSRVFPHLWIINTSLCVSLSHIIHMSLSVRIDGSVHTITASWQPRTRRGTAANRSGRRQGGCAAVASVRFPRSSGGGGRGWLMGCKQSGGGGGGDGDGGRSAPFAERDVCKHALPPAPLLGRCLGWGRLMAAKYENSHS